MEPITKPNLNLAWECLIAFVIGTIYAAALILGAGYFLGAGHGTEIVMKLVTSPLNVGPFLWPLLLVFYVCADYCWCRILGVITLLVHYVGLISQTIQSYDKSFFDNNHGKLDITIIVTIVAVHLIVNLILWIRFVGKRGG